MTSNGRHTFAFGSFKLVFKFVSLHSLQVWNELQISVYVFKIASYELKPFKLKLNNKDRECPCKVDKLSNSPLVNKS